MSHAFSVEVQVNGRTVDYYIDTDPAYVLGSAEAIFADQLSEAAEVFEADEGTRVARVTVTLRRSAGKSAERLNRELYEKTYGAT
jgi:hypothetical protein